MNVDELRRWISAEFWKSSQVTAWAERTFYRRKVHQQTNRGTSSGTQPIVTLPTGYVDPSFVNSSDHAEFIADTVGAMVTGNTETGITVTYQDSDNTIDFVVAAQDHGALTGLADNDHPQYGLLGSANTWTANNAFNSTATTGSALSVTRNLTSTSTDAAVVAAVQDHTGDDQDTLYVQQDGGGRAAYLLTLPPAGATNHTGVLVSIAGGSNSTGARTYTSLDVQSFPSGASLANVSEIGVSISLRGLQSSGRPIALIANTGDVIVTAGRFGVGSGTPGYDVHIQRADPVLVIQDTEQTGSNVNAQLILGESSSTGTLQGHIKLAYQALQGKLQIRPEGDATVYDVMTFTEALNTTFAGTVTATGVNVGEDTLTRYNDVTSWTPTIDAGTSSPSSVTYTTQQGRYTRFNTEVTVQARVAWSAKTGGSGQLQIPLPFTAYSSGPQVITGWIGSVGVVAFLIGTSATFAVPYNGTSAVTIGASGDVRIGGSYFVA